MFLGLWHENGRRSFEASYSRLDYDSPNYAKSARPRTKFIALDNGTSGAFLLDKETEVVYSIKAYGKPKSPIGTLDQMIDLFRQANGRNKTLQVEYLRKGEAVTAIN